MRLARRPIIILEDKVKIRDIRRQFFYRTAWTNRFSVLVLENYIHRLCGMLIRAKAYAITISGFMLEEIFNGGFFTGCQ